MNGNGESENRRMVDIGMEAALVLQPMPQTNEQWAEVGSRLVAKVESSLGEVHRCSKENGGHRYHMFTQGKRLYCRRCGTVIHADG